MKKIKITKRTIITYLIALGIAGLLTLATMSRIAKTADMAVSDALYQRHRPFRADARGGIPRECNPSPVKQEL